MQGQSALYLVYPEISLFSTKMGFYVRFYSFCISLTIALSGKVGDLLTLFLNFVSAALASLRSLLASRRERHFEF